MQLVIVYDRRCDVCVLPSHSIAATSESTVLCIRNSWTALGSAVFVNAQLALVAGNPVLRLNSLLLITLIENFVTTIPADAFLGCLLRSCVSEDFFFYINDFFLRVLKASLILKAVFSKDAVVSVHNILLCSELSFHIGVSVLKGICLE